jgi:DNA topoisomerase-1
VSISPTQHFTQPPPRYTEASLVKALEADNIGRPSTYAPIIQTIQDRKYVEILNRAFHPTDLGKVVTKKLLEGFPELFQVKFTAHMEDQLDLIEEDKSNWVSVLRDFYTPFNEQLEKAADNMVHAKAELQPSNHKCPECEAEMVYRFGKNGRFLSCGRYPDCKAALPIDRDGNPVKAKHTDIACPECASPLILRRGRFGPFLSCSKYPDCKGIVKLDRKGHVKHPAPPPLEIDMECPKCGNGKMNLRRGARGPWISCAAYPKCRGRAKWTAMDDDLKKQLEDSLAKHEASHPVGKICRLDGTELGDDYTPQEIEVQE